MRYIARFVVSREANLENYRKEIPQVEVYVDRERNPIGSFVRALEMAGNDPCVQMEDDCVLCRDFDKKVQAVVAERPDSLIQFFSMRKADITVGSRWDNAYLMGQCTYYPAGACASLLKYFKGSVWDLRQHEVDGLDLLVRDWLRHHKQKYWICVPNLVDHIVQKSVIDPRRSSKRVSKTFVP